MSNGYVTCMYNATDKEYIVVLSLVPHRDLTSTKSREPYYFSGKGVKKEEALKNSLDKLNDFCLKELNHAEL